MKNKHVGYEYPDGIKEIDPVVAKKLLASNGHKVGEHDGYTYFQNLPAVKVDLPFKLKGERNPKGGWVSIWREKDHSGELELVYLDEEESKQAERKGLS